ncbi:putative odorant receptor 85d [Drosophila novamexicana]|uniref:putative odorant receptor 85d n=1 Tax=Drosophila novamexicana TaxID=47314 RepID=UPI0011E60631|nr:putative odorant receptor 85d [Drosophila novamexicana]
MGWKLRTRTVPTRAIKTRKTIPLDSFFRYVDVFYLSIGMVPYDLNSKDSSVNRNWRRIILRSYFVFQMMNLNLVLLSELIYVFLAFASGQNFLEATMNLSFIGFVVVGDIKIQHIWGKRERLTQVVRRLQELHPVSAEEQAIYKIDEYLSGYKCVSIFYFGMHLVLIWTYNLYWAVYYLIWDFWLGIRRFERMLPYYCWTPWDWKNNWSYYVMYISQNLGGQACLSGQLAADMFMCALVTLLIMHFRRLGSQIERHVAGVLPAKQDLAFLQASIVYHQHLLFLCQDINEIFGVSLFCNFASSSFIICFVIFQMTIGGNIDSLVMLVLFLFCAMVQVFMIGSYAQRLINASEQIGEAVYKHDWFLADLRYRKLMLVIIQRAQRPSYLKATNLLKVSLVTVTDLLQLSYKFFALLRTMYVQ